MRELLFLYAGLVGVIALIALVQYFVPENHKHHRAIPLSYTLALPTAVTLIYLLCSPFISR